MSIIQEALKKIDPPARTERPAPSGAPAPAVRQAASAAGKAAAPAARIAPAVIAVTAPPAKRAPAKRPGVFLWAGGACAVFAVVAVAALFVRAHAHVKTPAVDQALASPAVQAEEPASSPPRQEAIYKTIEQSPAAAAGQAASVVRSAPPDLLLNGIMYLEAGPRAIINNAIVGVGDMVSGATVTAINKKSVILAYNNVEITLNLK